MELWIKNRLSRLVLLISIFIAQSPLAAETFYNATREGVAIGGYDPVAYLKDRMSKPGLPDLSVQWSGAEWRFASEVNKEVFLSEPEKYAPAYGGWCAMGMVGGDVVEVDFLKGWSIYDGKLHFNVDADIKVRWMRAAGRHTRIADKKWPDVQKEILEDRAKIFRKSQAPELYQ